MIVTVQKERAGQPVWERRRRLENHLTVLLRMTKLSRLTKVSHKTLLI